jgi:hypothetical protein
LNGRHGDIGARTWLGVCISTPRGFSLSHCSSIANQTAVTLIQRLREVSGNPMRKGFIVFRILTDNATSEMPVVRDLPKQLGVPVFLVPCLSHTRALALKDFLAQAFPPIARKDFFSLMIELPNLFPYQREDDLFHGIPRPCETR